MNPTSHLCKVYIPAERLMGIATRQRWRLPGHETSCKCGLCEVSLCVTPDSSIYHTQKH